MLNVVPPFNIKYFFAEIYRIWYVKLGKPDMRRWLGLSFVNIPHLQWGKVFEQLTALSVRAISMSLLMKHMYGADIYNTFIPQAQIAQISAIVIQGPGVNRLFSLRLHLNVKAYLHVSPISH